MGRAKPLDRTNPSQLRGKLTEWFWKTPATAAGWDKGHLLTARVQHLNRLDLLVVKESHDQWSRFLLGVPPAGVCLQLSLRQKGFMSDLY